MPRTDIIVGVLVVLAVINGVRAGVVARLFAWIGIAAGFLLLPTTVPLGAEYVPASTVGRAVLVRLAAGALTVLLCALLGTLIGRLVRVGVRLTPLSLLDRLGGVVFSLLVVGFALGSLLTATARLPGAVGEDVRRSTAYLQVQQLSFNLFSFWEVLPERFEDAPSDPDRPTNGRAAA